MGFFDFFSGGLVESVGKVADELITSDEERLEKENEKQKAELGYKISMRKADVEETKAYLKDTQNARKMNSDLVVSDDWLVRNTGSLLAWIVVLGTFSLDFMVIFAGIKETVADKEILMFVLGGLNTFAAGVIHFYFGSSKTEADSQRVVYGGRSMEKIKKVS